MSFKQTEWYHGLLEHFTQWGRDHMYSVNSTKQAAEFQKWWASSRVHNAEQIRALGADANKRIHMKLFNVEWNAGK